VIPPNADLAILHGRLQVLERAAPRGLWMPIDFFFRQLAADQRKNAISIILSGLGSDGTLGLKAIKENFGMAMVQDPASAKYEGMPRSADGAGLVDYVAAAEDLPAKLIQYVSHKLRPQEDHNLPEGESSAALQKVFVLLRAHTGNDFSSYKNNTVSRRIERRMSVHQLDSLRECLEGLSLSETPMIQVFATDIDHDAIEKARRGTFSSSIVSDVSPERLARFFVREGEGYRVRKEVRDLVVFAPQNILVDPPFTKLHIVCCRNLLIYINVETQKKLLPLMHYALNPGGLLILGSAESTSGFGQLFSPLDQKLKVFQSREVRERILLEMPAYRLRHEHAAIGAVEKDEETNMDIFYATQRELLDLYGPPSMVVTAEGDIIYINGRTQ